MQSKWQVLKLVADLYSKYSAAAAGPRNSIRVALNEAQRCGVVPLGMERVADGSSVFIWLVYDRTKFPNAAELDAYLASRTPHGTPFRIVML